MIRLILFFSLIGLTQSAAYCMVKFKENWKAMAIAQPFFVGPQISDASCKNLCMSRDDCVFADYAYEISFCRLFTLLIGPNYVVPNEDANVKINSWFKYPTTNCEDSSIFDRALSTKEEMTLPDKKWTWTLKLQNKSTYLFYPTLPKSS